MVIYIEHIFKSTNERFYTPMQLNKRIITVIACIGNILFLFAVLFIFLVILG